MKQRLDATFDRVQGVNYESELQSDFAKYLCILVSNYIERAVVELVLEHARRQDAPTLLRFVESRTRRFANANSARIQDLLGSFDPTWRQRLESILVDDRKAAVDSVVSLRNAIAHGQPVGVTYFRIKEYYQRVQDVIDQVADVCVPN